MNKSFTISRDTVTAGDRPGLLREVMGHTGSEDQADSILRSLDRLGSDASIRYYEMTAANPQRRYASAPSVVWTVRAVRPGSDG